jgi:hypothetical protein
MNKPNSSQKQISLNKGNKIRNHKPQNKHKMHSLFRSTVATHFTSSPVCDSTFRSKYEIQLLLPAYVQYQQPVNWQSSVFGGICRQTPTTHMINICETLQVISVKVQVITPWWWILCDPKHVGVIFNYVSFKLLYDIDFNMYVLYNWVH